MELFYRSFVCSEVPEHVTELELGGVMSVAPFIGRDFFSEQGTMNQKICIRIFIEEYEQDNETLYLI